MTPNKLESSGLSQQIRDRLVVKRVECRECGEQPRVYWKDGAVELGCDCGTRSVPKGVVLNHEFMPDGVEWTVVEDD